MIPTSGVRVVPYPRGAIPSDVASQQRHERVIATAKQAVQVWAAMQKQQPIRKKLPPWEENTYYDIPTTTQYTFTANIDQIIAPSNPNRMVLIFSVPAGQAGGINIKPGVAVNPAIFDGINLIATTQPWTITQETHKFLAGIEWHGMSAVTSALIMVTELVLRQLPPSP